MVLFCSTKRCFAFFVFRRQYDESNASRRKELRRTRRISLTYAVQSVPLRLFVCLPFCLYFCERACLSACLSLCSVSSKSVVALCRRKSLALKSFSVKIEVVQVEGGAIRAPAHFLRIQAQLSQGLLCAPDVSTLPAGRRPKYVHVVLVCLPLSTGGCL